MSRSSSTTTRITSENALDLIRRYDIVVDGTDNFPTRYLTNDACVLLKKPNVYGSIFRFEGQASVFAPHLGGPCYRCLYPEPPPPGMVPSCAEGGVLGVSAGHHRLHSGHGDSEAGARQGQFAGRPAAAVQRARHEIPRTEAPARSAMPGLRRASDDHGIDRLRTVLRHRRPNRRTRGATRTKLPCRK